jgi:xanthosine utilization system XapX-like protein
VALVGLLGILAGEQVIPVGRQILAGHSLSLAWERAKGTAHLFGDLPGRHARPPAANEQAPTDTHS